MVFTPQLLAQDSLLRKNSWMALPIGYYKPETGIALGAAAAYNFYIHPNDSVSPASQVQLSAVFTQKGQMSLALPFNLYWKQRTHSIIGQFEYNDFNYDFFGVGAGNSEGVSERYHVRFPLFRINYLRKIYPNVFVGLRWWYEDYQLYKKEDSPWLTGGSITGGNGGVSSGPGLVAMFDTRDNIYFSTKGFYIEAVAHDQAKHWGSDFSFQRYRLDARMFHALNSKWSLGSMLFADVTTGSVPFNQLASIGSDKRMRGFLYGRYRDKALLLYQGEVRGYFYKRWGATAFWNYAILGPAMDKLSVHNDHLSAGLGLRYAFDKEKRTNIRLDVSAPIGIGALDNLQYKNPFVFYLTLNEAF
jgi:outer membrane protein assembly factor BamA